MLKQVSKALLGIGLVRGREIINYAFRLDRSLSGKARGGRIAGYLTDE